jgi:cupin 2 domain-containing protein
LQREVIVPGRLHRAVPTERGDSDDWVLTNLFADIPEELIQALLCTPGLRIERIVSLGHASPEGFWYDQEASEWVLLLKGAARLRFEGEEPIELRPGAFVNIPPHRRHRVEWTDPHEPTIWLAIHYGGGSS